MLKIAFYNETFPIIKSIIDLPETNLFNFILNSLHILNSHLSINTKITISSNVDIDHTLKSKDKVIALCKKTNANTYINAIGGQELYNVKDFKDKNLELKFIKSNPLIYTQYKNEFIPWLSILDVLMFNGKQNTINYLNKFTLI